MNLDEFRPALDRWLDEHAAELAPQPSTGGRWTSRWPSSSKVKRLAFDAGWMRWGWPERVGGLGGSTLLRGYLGEALTTRDLVEPGLYSMTEVLAPTMIDYARPELAAEMVPRLLRGDETWCQGFSEPGTGSNLAALSAGPPGSPTAGGSPARRCGPAWPSTPSAACCSPAPAPRVGAPGHHRPVRRHGHPGHHRAAASRPCTAARSSARSSSTTSPCPPTARLGTWARAGRWPWTCCPTSAARRCGTGGLPAPAAGPAPGGRPRRLAPRRGGRGVPAALRPPRPIAGHPAPDGRRRAARPETSIDKVLLADHRAGRVRPIADGLATRCCWATTRRRALALRVPLLAGRHHLRRQRRDPAQHHRPAPARPGGRPVMDRRGARAVRQGPGARDRPAHRGSLERGPERPRLGGCPWRRPAGRVSLLFELQGAASAAWSALDQVMASALGLDPRCRWCCHRSATCDPPGYVTAGA